MKKIHLFQKDIKNISDRLLKDLGTIPFKIHNNNNIINIIFDTYKEEYNSHNYFAFYNKFKDYFIKVWNKYFIDGTLNYIFLKKIQRSNSYLENYNKRIKHLIGPFLSEKGRTIIPWPLLLIFIKKEENYYRQLILKKLTEDTVHKKDKLIEKSYIENDNFPKKEVYIKHK